MPLEPLTRDVRSACRGLWRAKAFTGAAVLTLAIGIAGTTVMFALVQGVLLRPLPVLTQDRLLVAWKEVRTSGSAHYPFGSYEIDAIAETSQLLERTAGVGRHGAGRAVMVEDGVASSITMALVTGGFFEVLGVRPLLGRTLARADDVEGAEHVVAISHGFWQRHYGGSREVIGRRVTLSDLPFTIVGVMPAGLDYPRGVEMWRLTRSMSADGPFGDAARREVDLIARLRPGAGIEQAADEISALTERLDATAPPGYLRGLVPVVRSFEDVVVGDVRPALLALFAAVGLVLLIASANVANLLLMRSEGRRREMAVRAALGAGRARIVRLLLAESLLVALAAGVAGLVLAWWSLQAAITLVPDGLPRVESVQVDAGVVAFSIFVAFATALLAGVAPALSSMRADVASHLRSGGPGITSRTVGRGRRALVVAQVALAVTIVAAAGLLITTVAHLHAVDTGMASERLVLVNLSLPAGKYAERARHAQLLDDLIGSLEAAPAIAAATPVNMSPFSGQGWDLPRFTAEGQTADQAAANPSLHLESIHPNYFGTLDVPLVRGRAFTAADRPGALPVAILSEDIAARTWPGDAALGKRLKMGRPDSREPWYTVVGVAAQTRYREIHTPRPTLYLPAAQFQMTAEMLVLRSAAPLDLVAALARDRIRSVDPAVHVMRVARFTDLLEGPLARPTFNAFLLGAFAAVALLLSVVGLYAVLATYVRQHDREIGVRLALGATATRIRRFVLFEALRLAGLGAVLGIVCATSATHLLKSLLFAVHPLDPPTIIGAALLLMSACALASYLPVRRAMRVDPVEALRTH